MIQAGTHTEGISGQGGAFDLEWGLRRIILKFLMILPSFGGKLATSPNKRTIGSVRDLPSSDSNLEGNGPQLKSCNH